MFNGALYRNGTKIKDVIDYTPPSETREEIDVTTWDSGDAKEFKLGRKDSGKAPFEIGFDPSDAQHKDLQDGVRTMDLFEVDIYSEGGVTQSYAYSGSILSSTATLPTYGAMKLAVDVRVSGNVDITTN